MNCVLACCFAPESPPSPLRLDRDVAPELEKLRIKAVVKSRDFLFAKIWDFRRPRTNVQVQGWCILLR